MSTFARNLELKEKLSLEQLQQLDTLFSARKKDKALAYVLLILLGGLGLHRIYIGKILSGIIMAITMLTLFFSIIFPFIFSYTSMIFFMMNAPFAIIALLIIGTWYLVDLFLLSHLVDQKNNDIEYELIKQFLEKI